MTTRFLKSRSTLGVSDVGRTITFYREALGFEVRTTMGDPPVFAVVVRDDVGLGLVRMDSPAPLDFACCYFDVEGVELLHERCVKAGATIVSPLTRHPWGNYDFVVQDPDGNRVAIGEAAPHT
jgi:predicted enzyme related to lactoylglutathione lyase